MSKHEKEMAIIEGIKKLGKSGYGDYHYSENLIMIIAKVMGYEVTTMRGGKVWVSEIVTVWEIINRMQDKGIIKLSKSRSMFKMV